MNTNSQSLGFIGDIEVIDNTLSVNTLTSMDEFESVKEEVVSTKLTPVADIVDSLIQENKEKKEDTDHNVPPGWTRIAKSTSQEDVQSKEANEVQHERAPNFHMQPPKTEEKDSNAGTTNSGTTDVSTANAGRLQFPGQNITAQAKTNFASAVGSKKNSRQVAKQLESMKRQAKLAKLIADKKKVTSSVIEIPPHKVEYDSGKYKIIRLDDKPRSGVILSENGIEIKGAFFDGEGIQIFNIDDIELLFVFNIDTGELVRVVDLEYRSMFITKVQFDTWSVMHPSPKGDYIVVVCKTEGQQVNASVSEMSVGIFLVNMADLMSKVRHHRFTVRQQEIIARNEEEIIDEEIDDPVQEGEKVDDEEKVDESIHKEEKVDEEKKEEKKEVTTPSELKKDEVVTPNTAFKVVNVNGQNTETIKTAKPDLQTAIKLKVIAKANVFRMKTISSKVNIKCDDIMDNLYSEEKWISDDVFEIKHFLKFNKKHRKSLLQLNLRNSLDMIKNREPLEPCLYKTIHLTCSDLGTSCMTTIEEEVWNRWEEVRKETLSNQHYVTVMQEQFTPYKKFTKMLESKINQKNHQFYTAIIDPIYNEDGTRYSDEISSTVANFEIHFPKFSDHHIIYFVYKDGIVTIQKIFTETATTIYDKSYPNFEAGVRALNRFI